jgi:glutathione peroxidase
MKHVNYICGVFLMAASLTSNLSAQTERNTIDEKTSPLAVKMKTIDGGEVLLADKYKNKVVMIVNTASKCGLTPQYKHLQELHEKYSDKGLAILGFPCNQFLGQEPGTEDEIKQFCQKNYGVEFDMFAKIDVKGDKQSQLYGSLTALDLKPAGTGDISWNFEKFLLGRDGKPIARFGPRTKPDSKEVVDAIERALTE